jgi:hypothetical protein
VGSKTDNSGQSHKVKKIFREEVLRIGAFWRIVNVFRKKGSSGSCSSKKIM